MLLQQVDDDSYRLALEMAKVKKDREETEVRYTEELTDLVSKLDGQLAAEKKARATNHNNAMQRLQSETARIQDMVLLEKKVREETQ